MQQTCPNRVKSASQVGGKGDPQGTMQTNFYLANNRYMCKPETIPADNTDKSSVTLRKKNRISQPHYGPNSKKKKKKRNEYVN